LKEQINTETPLLLTQQLIYQFGELLSWWPKIVKSTKEVRSKGQRIAAQVN